MRDTQMQSNGSPVSNPSQDAKAVDNFAASSPDLLKHPLENQWTLWYFKNDRSKGWEYNQQKVMAFNTVEDFWSVFNHIEQVSNLTAGCDYSFFKSGIKPMWEDEANKNGGRWVINIDRRQRSSGLIDKLWLEIILCMIGEGFEDSGTLVNGAVVNVRPKGDKICLWLSECLPKEAVLQVGRKLKKNICNDDTQIIFEGHADSMQKSSSTVKSMYVL